MLGLQDRTTLVHEACGSDRPKLVEALLDHDANPEAKTEKVREGQNPSLVLNQDPITSPWSLRFLPLHAPLNFADDLSNEAKQPI